MSHFEATKQLRHFGGTKMLHKIIVMMSDTCMLSLGPTSPKYDNNIQT